MKKVVIVGAGPSGLLMAHYLLRRDEAYQVTIYERRSDPRTVQFSQARTFPVSLNTRGMQAIEAVEGLAAALKAIAQEMTGALMHSQKGKPKYRPRNQPLFTLDRTRLAMVLLEELVKRFDNSRLQIQFDSECQQIDFATQTLKLKTGSETEFTDRYDFLIGADGVNSVVRQHFEASADFKCDRQMIPNAYKSVVVSLEKLSSEVDLREGTLHSWRTAESEVLLMLHQGDGTMAGALYFPREQNRIADLASIPEVLQFFEKHFPEIGQLMSEKEAETFLKRPISTVDSVRCSRYHQGNQALVIGDAAHAVSPSLGQGCNSALEDVVVFDRLLDESAGDLAEAIAQFTSRRQADAEAVVELSDYAFPNDRRLMLEFFLRQSLAKWLHQSFSQRFPPSLFQLVSDSTMPYSEILQLHRGWIDKVKRVQSSKP